MIIIILHTCQAHSEMTQYPHYFCSLVRSDVMEELVTLTTVEPSGDVDEKTRYKYPNIACELLTCDVPAINERLAGDEALLGKLYAFLESDKPLNPLLASFFSKTIGVLVARKTEQVSCCKCFLICNFVYSEHSLFMLVE